MAHLIDNSKGFNAFIEAKTDQPAWHGIGIIKDSISTEDAKQVIDYTVVKAPNHHIIPIEDGKSHKTIISTDSFFTYRSDVNKVLGTKLGKDYTVLQNTEILTIVEEILQKGTTTIETAGVIDEGKKAFVCLNTNKTISVGSNDIIKQYVLIATSHDGSMGIMATPTNIRVVCNNTLSAALRNAHGATKIRHTANANSRLYEAMKVLKLIEDNSAINEDTYNEMQNTVISKEQMFDYFGSIFFTKDEITQFQQGKKADEVISTRKQNILTEVLNFANNGVGQSLAMEGEDHTLWSAYNAVTGYVTRRKYSSLNDRANSMMFGSSAQLIHDAGVLAANPSKIVSISQKIIPNLNFN